MRFELSRLLAPIEADLVVLHRLKSIDRAQSDLPVSWILFRRVIGHDLAPRLLPERHQRVMHRFIHPSTTYSPQNKSISNIRSMNYHRKWSEERNSIRPFPSFPFFPTPTRSINCSRWIPDAFKNRRSSTWMDERRCTRVVEHGGSFADRFTGTSVSAPIDDGSSFSSSLFLFLLVYQVGLHRQ